MHLELSTTLQLSALIHLLPLFVVVSLTRWSSILRRLQPTARTTSVLSIVLRIHSIQTSYQTMLSPLVVFTPTRPTSLSYQKNQSTALLNPMIPSVVMFAIISKCPMIPSSRLDQTVS